MRFENLLLYEYKFWEVFKLGKLALCEDGFFSDSKEAEHYRDHVYQKKDDWWRSYILYKGSDNIERYLFPKMSLEKYVEMGNALMNDTSDPNITGWVDTYFLPVLGNKPVYIKKRPSTYEIKKSSELETSPEILPHEEYVAYQIDDNGERKILSYGLIDKLHWQDVEPMGKLLEPLPKTELDNKDDTDIDTKKYKKEIPQVLVYYIDTTDGSLKTKTMKKDEAQNQYSKQWSENNINNTTELIYKAEGIIDYPPNRLKKQQFWLEQEDKYGVDLSGNIYKKIDEILTRRNIEHNDEFVKSFVKAYTMPKLRHASIDKIWDNANNIIKLVGDAKEEVPYELSDLFESYHKLIGCRLDEANRQQLLQKSRNAQNYKNTLKGKNRYERRNKSQISATVRDYNEISMDELFKRDILELKIPVIGETDVYQVDVRVDGLLAEVQKQVVANKGKLEFKVILQSLMKVLNMGDVYIGCDCPDGRYRMAYSQTKNGYKAGYKETRPSDKTNPNDTLGAGCKHVMLILANLDWAVKVASVVNNYIKYCKDHFENNYAEYIFPKVYGVKYDKAVQLSLFDDGLLPSDKKTIDAAISQGMAGKDEKGRFVKNNPSQFKPKVPHGIVNPNQTELDLENEEESQQI